MISGLQVAFKHAIDVIAPPVTPLQDFTYHWKQIKRYYIDHLPNNKVPIEQTGIPKHLDRLLEILLLEEKDGDETGACLEYLLQYRLLDLLVTLAAAETPAGMRFVCLSFLRKLLGRSRHPLLHHVAVYVPVQRLIVLCNGNLPSPIETEEVQFLLTLCFLVCKYPHVTGIVDDSDTDKKIQNFEKPWTSSERMETEKVTYIPARERNDSNPLFEPLDTQAITLINPNLLDDRRKSSSIEKFELRKETGPGLSNYSPDLDLQSQTSTPVSQKGDAMKDSDFLSSLQEVEAKMKEFGDSRIEEFNFEDILSDRGKDENYEPRAANLPEKASKCLLLDALISYLNSADNTVRIRACEGIMVLASLEDSSFSQIVASSELATVLALRLEKLFNAIPAHVDTNDIDEVDVTWGLDSPVWTSEKKFPGCRQVAAFYMWLDYCDQLVKEARPDVAEVLGKTIRRIFFEGVVTQALADHHVVLITSLVTKCLKEISSSVLSNEISQWLVGQHRDPEIPQIWTTPVLHRLIENCLTESDDLTLETLKLFEEMIDKRNEHILHCLVLTYLTTRGYYDNTAADSTIASWSDEEDEREREKKGSLDLSYEQNHSRTLAPSNIHRVINCFLSLVPKHLQTDSDINNYERYMADWEKQYAIVLADCALLAWPLEAVTVDDSASSDSRPEADHCSTRFYMGPFLNMLLDKVLNIPRQRYEINLQLTVVISRLALLPHPYLHEFLLNPLIPLVPGTKSLFACLQKVVKQLVNEVPRVQDHKKLLRETRQRLLDDFPHEQMKESILFESVIITEEFCKELAAIAYVKYHHSS